ncbi:MAG TPA: hypothetical protein DEP60_04370, partial [Ruminococcaceae bacterium]|nr:hypothetical protein [Oscillospiraceae bacterium]
KDSVGLVSDRTILAHHPFVDDVDKELEQMKEQKQEEVPAYPPGVFPQHDNGQPQEPVNSNEKS